jgi:hypothetical protein
MLWMRNGTIEGPQFATRLLIEKEKIDLEKENKHLTQVGDHDG